VEKYQIYRIEPSQIIINREIADGVLGKVWCHHPELGECLFKEGSLNQSIVSESKFSVDWSEKVVSELASLLNLPTARSELAIGSLGDLSDFVEGVVSINCVPLGAVVLTGSEFLSEQTDYDPDNPRHYSIEKVLAALDAANVQPPSSWQQPEPSINTGVELFVGYLLLDALTANSHHHDRNWSIISLGENIELMPTYDRGLSLGSIDEDSDKFDLSLSDYVETVTSPFQDGNNRLSTLTVFTRAARLYADAGKIWQERLDAIALAQIDEIFNRIPDNRISPIAKNFARQLLEHNCQEIMKIDLESLRTTSVTLAQIDNLVTYYTKSPEGRDKPERIGLTNRIKSYKSQILQHGRAVTSDPNLISLTRKFFKTFISNQVTLSPEDRANLQAANKFANEQKRIATAARARPQQRIRGFKP
jgi:hypothetical protein